MPPFKKDQLFQPTLPILGTETSEAKQPGNIEENLTFIGGAASDTVMPEVQIDVPPGPEIVFEPDSVSHMSEVREPSTKDESASSEQGDPESDTTSTDGISYGGESEPDDSEDTEEQRKSKKRLPDAEKNFTRKNGIVYVVDESWLKWHRYAVDCHLYVSSTSNAKPAMGDDTAGTAGLESRPRTPSSASCKPQETSTAEVVVPVSYNLPARVAIMNDLLLDEMKRVTGISSFNHDHVPPFRSIVPFEHEFRKLHEQKEREFARLSSATPNDPAVQRTKQWVPNEFSYSSSGRRDELVPSRNDIVRILLDGLRALVYFLDNDLAHLVEAHRQIKAGTVEKLPFAYLWHLFQPGQEIVSKSPKQQVYRVLQVSGGRKSLRGRSRGEKKSVRKTVSNLDIDCFYLDFDGKHFRAVPTTISIKPYDDALPIQALEAYPMRYEHGGLEKALIERGEKFTDLVKVRHQRYNGLSLKEGDVYDRCDEIEGDVIIDFELAFRNSEPKIQTPNFGGGVILKPTEEDEEETRDGVALYYDDEEYMQRRWSQFVHNTNLLEAHTFQTLTRDSLILLPYRVYGYVLLSRKWYPLDIDLVKDVPTVKDGDNDGFEKLIIPDGHKNIVRALVKTHARGGSATGNKQVSQPPLRQFDVVKGKGKGLIILLHGAPGVGKTSTAECVAANAGRPLFPITCGDLGGTSAQEVERNLEKFFDLARKWGCVLLLDEADVFLTARDRGLISQNILVSVFLRVLEYYSGILILTTNRVGDFDEAVKSRVHCALYYPPLDRRNTKKIWKMNLDILQAQNESPDCTKPVRFDRKEILEFADRHWKDGNRWNGRQIKNAFQTAVALADWDSLKGSCGGDATLHEPQLERRHFETVSMASTHFDMYLSEVRGDDETRARMNEVREDEYDLSRGHVRRAKPTRRKSSYGGKVRHFEHSDSDTSDTSSSEEVESSDTTDSESVVPPEPMRKKGTKRSDKRKGRKD